MRYSYFREITTGCRGFSMFSIFDKAKILK